MYTLARKQASTTTASLASGTVRPRLQQPVNKDLKDNAVPTNNARPVLTNITNKQHSLNLMNLNTNQSQKLVKPTTVVQPPSTLAQQMKPRLPSAGNENKLLTQKSESSLTQNLGSTAQTPQKQKFAFNVNSSLSNSASKGGLKVIHMMKSPGFDTQNADNPKHMSEIVKEIITNMKESESKHAVPEGWIDNKEFLNASMKMITPYAREKLVDEVMKFCYKCGFTTPTIYLTVNYFDRFVYGNPKKCTTNSGIVTAGLVCAWIAAKYEEIHPPSVDNIAECYKLKKSSFLEMEMQVLSTLGYHCTISTVYPFLKRFLHADLATVSVSQAAHFISQMTLMYSQFSSMKSSKLAAAALYVARMIVCETNTSTFPTMNKILGVVSLPLKCANTNFEADPKYWSSHAEYYTGYELKEIFTEICAILRMLAEFEKQPKVRVITTVFSDKKKGCVCTKVREYMKTKGVALGF